MKRAPGQRGHLREISTICPDAMVLSSGAVLARCELARGHGGNHKDGCTRWGGSAQATSVDSPKPRPCSDEWQPQHDAGSRPEHCGTCGGGRRPKSNGDEDGTDRG